MPTELTFERICELLRAQAKSTEMWIQQYERFRDIGGVRNAAMGIGKVAGHFNILVATGCEVPDDIVETMERMNDVWANLTVKE